MTLPNGFQKDLTACLGDRRVANIVFDTLNTLGADGAFSVALGEMTTLIVTTITGLTTVQTTGEVACFTLDGNGIVMSNNQDITVNGGDLVLAGGADLTFTGTTGQNHIFITDNLAASLDVKISGGNTFLLFDTTDSDEKVTLGPAGCKLAFRGGTPQAAPDWTAWTGNATRSTIATGSATATQCAEAIKAIVDDLLALGIFT